MAIATTVSLTTTHRRRDMKAGSGGHLKAAELVSGLGAIVLGAGAALMLPEWLRAHALPLLAVGALVHGFGMTLRYRLERRDGPPLWWERALFWLCGFGLAALGLWIAVVYIAR
ncbi:MAG: hypothetical protein KGI90_13125 [Burkholderiales bacterium]|nr:hypothetical protein [Burkholderiales bacterium]MDE2274856.1 hypothetical protein [Burkholderiales bacterium]